VWGQTRDPAVRRAVAPSFTTVGDVLAYRQTWDAFVIAVNHAVRTMADAWDASADGKPPSTPPNPQFATAETPEARASKMRALAGVWRQDADTLEFEWNLHRDLKDYEILLRASSILVSQQKTVQFAGRLRAEVSKYCPELPLPDPPTLDLQAQTIGRLEAIAIVAHGVLQLFAIGAGGALDTYGAIGSTLGGAARALSSPGTIAAVVAGVGVLALVVWSQSSH
jgi:hypothetical protein